MSSTDEYEQQSYWKKPSFFVKKEEWDWMNYCMGNWDDLTDEQIENFEVFPPREKSFDSNQKVETLTIDELIKRYPLTVEEVNALKEKQK